MLDLPHLCMFAGMLIIAGAMFLVFKEKIYLDAQTNKVMKVELPFFGKVQTNAPAFAIIVLGFAAIIYPLHLNQTEYIRVTQIVTSDTPVSLDAYAVSKQTTVGNDQKLELSIPMLADPDYEPHLILHSATIWHEISIDKKAVHHGELKLEALSLQGGNTQPIIQAVNAPRPAGFQ